MLDAEEEKANDPQKRNSKSYTCSNAESQTTMEQRRGVLKGRP